MMRMIDLIKVFPAMYDARTAVHIVGPPGCGKSDVLKYDIRRPEAEGGPVDAGETTAQPPHVDPAPGDDVVEGDLPDAPEPSADGDSPDAE